MGLTSRLSALGSLALKRVIDPFWLKILFFESGTLLGFPCPFSAGRGVLPRFKLGAVLGRWLLPLPLTENFYVPGGSFWWVERLWGALRTLHLGRSGAARARGGAPNMDHDLLIADAALNGGEFMVGSSHSPVDPS